MTTFTQKIRLQNKSLILTIPSSIVKLLKLKDKDFCEISDIKKLEIKKLKKRGKSK